MTDNLDRLDVLIAEKVMGLEYRPHIMFAQYEGWYPKGSYCYHDDRGIVTPSGYLQDLPHYTTDIAAAFKIIEKLKDFKPACLSMQENGDWLVYFYPPSEDLAKTAKAKTLPLAIVLAALAATGHEGETE